MHHSSSVLRDFVTHLMECEGALVERIDPLGIEFVVPERLGALLGLPEQGRLGFGWQVPENAQRVSFESDWLDRLGAVLGQRGRVLRNTLNVQCPPPAFPERLVERSLGLQNAVFRVLRVLPTWTSYRLLTFRYSALSDEKRDGIAVLAFNLSNGSPVDDVLDPLLTAVASQERAPEWEEASSQLPAFLPAERLAQLGTRGLSLRIRSRLAPFLASLQRRLDRDLAQVSDYYNGLSRESQSGSRKLPLEPERERLRLDAIAREHEAKVADLRQKYALKIAVEWVQTLELSLPVHRVELLLKRRKGERPFHLDWNPVARRLERPLCEATFTVESGRIMCDGALHLVSLAAHAGCQQCHKPYCRACYPRTCPKCGSQSWAE
jgi:hypothetical protein